MIPISTGTHKFKIQNNNKFIYVLRIFDLVLVQLNEALLCG